MVSNIGKHVHTRMGAVESAKNTPNSPKFIGSMEKASFGVRSPWQQALKVKVISKVTLITLEFQI